MIQSGGYEELTDFEEEQPNYETDDPGAMREIEEETPQSKLK
jgi:hypothetical protein